MDSNKKNKQADNTKLKPVENRLWLQLKTLKNLIGNNKVDNRGIVVSSKIPQFKKGMEIFFKRGIGDTVEFEGEKYISLTETAVIGIVE